MGCHGFMAALFLFVLFLRGYILYVFHDILYPAIQYSTEHINGVGADAFIALEPGDLGGADAVLKLTNDPENKR